MKKAYSTPTKQSMIDLAKKLKKEGVVGSISFYNGDYWDTYRENTCISIQENALHFGKQFVDYPRDLYTIFPYEKKEKKLKYGYCKAGDIIVDTDNKYEGTIWFVNEFGILHSGSSEKYKACFLTWNKVDKYERALGWKLEGAKCKRCCKHNK